MQKRKNIDLRILLTLPQQYLKTLKEIGVKEEDLQALAESAFVDACTPGNPRDTSVAEILEIYKSIY
jgi:alcohol dehydrogenase class IV